MIIIDKETNTLIDKANLITEDEVYFIVHKDSGIVMYMKDNYNLIDIEVEEHILPQRYKFVEDVFIELPKPPEPIIEIVPEVIPEVINENLENTIETTGLTW